jgi:hypothetical protein
VFSVLVTMSGTQREIITSVFSRSKLEVQVVVHEHQEGNSARKGGKLESQKNPRAGETARG